MSTQYSFTIIVFIAGITSALVWSKLVGDNVETWGDYGAVRQILPNYDRTSSTEILQGLGMDNVASDIASMLGVQN